MDAYLKLVQHVRAHGELRPNRTGINALGVFGGEFNHDLQLGFPLLTTKTVNFESVLAELFGFLSGAQWAYEFRALGTKIWDANANETQSWLDNPHRRGTDHLGPIYGKQWRIWESNKVLVMESPDAEKRLEAYLNAGYRIMHSWNSSVFVRHLLHKTIDQLQELINGIKHDPYGRRHIVTAWNPGDLGEVALPACHAWFQCYVRGQYLDLKMYQRSADLFLGVPFNIASYAALTHLLAKVTGYLPGRLTITFGDLHIYENHMEQVEEQLRRTPRALPQLHIADPAPRISSLSSGVEPVSIDDFTQSMFRLHGYDPEQPLRAAMAK